MDVHASLTEVSRLAVVLVAQGDQVEQLHVHIKWTQSLLMHYSYITHSVEEIIIISPIHTRDY